MIHPCSPARYLVCEGALCSCDKTAAPTAMKVVSHHRFYIHSSSGMDRPVVTNHDNDQRALHFSSCLASGKPEPCIPQLLWQIPGDQQRIILANGACPLPDNATAQCLSRGGRIHFLTHGQLPGGNADSPGIYSPDNQPPADRSAINFPENTPHLVSITGPEKIRQLRHASWEAVFDRPPDKSDVDLIYWSLQNDQGTEVAACSGDDTFHHRFMDDGQYTLRIFGGEDATIMLSLKIQVTPTGIICSQRHARPGQRISFTVADAEPADIFTWEEIDEEGNHHPLSEAGSHIQHTFEQPGRYVIRATNAKQAWQQSVTISRNQVCSISPDRTPVNGNITTFSITTTFPDLNEREQFKLHWKLTGPESSHCIGETTFRHLFTHCGHYTLYAYLYNIQQEGILHFEVKNAAVITARWTTPNGVVIRQAGYDQDVCMYFEHAGLEEKKVQLEIYARQAFHKTLIQLLPQQSVTQTKVFRPLSVNSLRQQLRPGWNNQQIAISFRIKPVDNMPLEQQDSPQLLLHYQPRIVEIYFTDHQDQRRYFNTDHHQKIAVKVHAANLTNQRLQITLLRRRGSPPLLHPLTPYPNSEIHPLLEKDIVISRHEAIVDKAGTILQPISLESLSEISLVYALIELPGYNTVYSRQLFVYPGQQLQLPASFKVRSSTIIERVSVSEDPPACQSLVWGSKVSCAFRKKVIDIAKRLQADPNHLMTCMAFETGGSFLPHLLSGYKAKNTPAVEELTEGLLERHAVGLVQFTQTGIDQMNDLWNLGATKKKLACMSAIEQLEYVYHYLREFKGRLNSLQDFYMTILKPEGVGKDDEYIVFSRELDVRIRKQWYAKNRGLDTNNDDKITKKEVSIIIHKKYAEGLNYKNGCALDCPFSSSNFPSQNSKWHHPTDNLQLRGWYDSWDPRRSRYGMIEGRKSGKHQGLDFYAPVGTPVYACVEGTIVSSYYSYSYGNVVVLNGTYENNSYYFFYAHLQTKSLMEVGSTVNMGTIIGHTGKTGNAAGMRQDQEHLHFEIRTEDPVGRGFEGRLNPLEVISELNKDEIINPSKNNQYAK
ncbi:peptidoglycan DD-metalloendopeptidase family protein [Chitinophaga qingshengii]|uniref:Peptidoglycan DD-metalloendopeptidase family protein n=1 Tax=Chitinophaga qingshengii TaxID=1569794 RepID=A0ABR7TMM4_9BACT|nr:peptidoglycan DD-metalloendopeptidase family protein [Chitinophaga qingshengii]MBC9930880.1 peptidoglycan DD-metalloendopeptidase family protein [Chitinophaga qingshengii]